MRNRKKYIADIICILLTVMLLLVSTACNTQIKPNEATSDTENSINSNTGKESESQSESESETETVSSDVVYAFTNSEPGYAGGIVTVQVAEPSLVTLYWGNDDGKLPGYTYLSRSVSVDGYTVMTIPNTTFIPSDAICLIAVCEDNADKDVMEFKYQIPEEKRFSEDALFTFGALADVHVGDRYDEEGLIPYDHFMSALEQLTSLGASTITISGDITTSGNSNKNLFEYIFYAEYIDEFHENHPEIGVYTCTGNHECIWRLDVRHFIECTRECHDATYSGELTRTYYGDNDLDYTISVADDVIFVFLNQIYTEYNKSESNPHILEEEQLDWLEARLSENKDKTVFLFFHTYLDDQAGDASSPEYEYDSPYNITDQDEIRFAELLGANPNVIFCNGHSHYRFDMMFYEPAAEEKNNLYTNCMGGDDAFAQVHIPSTAAPRVLKSKEQYLSEYNAALESGITSSDIHISWYIDSVEDSQGYLVKVYSDSVVFYGYDFVDGEYVSYACYILPRQN